MPKMLAPFRPASRDKLCTTDSLATSESRSRPGSSHNTTSIMSGSSEGTPIIPTAVNRKKRRSSLSDLVKVQETAALAPLTPLQPRQLPSTPSPEKTRYLPKTPHTRNPSLTNRLDRSSPPRSGIPRLGPPQRRENSPLKAGSNENSPSPHANHIKQSKVQGSPGEVTITSYSPQKRSTSRTNNAPPKTSGLSERTWPPNTNNIHKTPALEDAAPKKLRMQSPQKIRERLKQEQEAAAGTELGLQNEINKISEEMSRFKLRAPRHLASSTPVSSSLPTIKGSEQQQQPTIDALSAKLDTLHQSLQTYIATHTTTTTHLRTSLDDSLLVANRKVRKLDDLYKEANAENEALYDRFNDELVKILGRVKNGEGVAEMKSRLDDALKEAAALRSERAGLKREIVALRSLVQE